MQSVQLQFLNEKPYVFPMQMIDKRWELKILGEEPTGFLVELPDGTTGYLEANKADSYIRTTENTLINKNNNNTSL